MRLGFVTELLSKSIRYGDMNGYLEEHSVDWKP